MHIKYNTTNKPQPPVFVLAADKSQTPEFQHGKCSCKACGSMSLQYYNYIEDAKCDECRQWQNEDLLPM